MANGLPSSRRQIAATLAPHSSSRSAPPSLLSTPPPKSGQTARARSTNNRTASYRRRSERSSAPGVRSGGMGQRRSPATPSGARLVTRMWRSAAAPSNRPTRSTTASIRCSQLSRTSSAPDSTTPAAHSSGDLPPAPTAAANCSATSAAPSAVASDTQATRTAGCAVAHCSAAAKASRVFPPPPGPVTVSSRVCETRAATSAASSSRPTSGVSGPGAPSIRAGPAEGGGATSSNGSSTVALE